MIDFRELVEQAKKEQAPGFDPFDPRHRYSEAEWAEIEKAREAQRKAQREVDAAQRETDERAFIALSGIWKTVSSALVAKSPPPDILILNETGSREIDKALRKSINAPSSDRAKSKLHAAHKRAEDHHSSPAWDMMSELAGASRMDRDIGEGPVHIFTYPMYMDDSGNIHCYHLSQTGGLSDPLFRSREPILFGQRLRTEFAPEWEVNNPDKLELLSNANRYEQIKIGLANLVAKHSLEIGL